MRAAKTFLLWVAGLTAAGWLSGTGALRDYSGIPAAVVLVVGSLVAAPRVALALGLRGARAGGRLALSAAAGSLTSLAVSLAVAAVAGAFRYGGPDALAAVAALLLAGSGAILGATAYLYSLVPRKRLRIREALISLAIAALVMAAVGAVTTLFWSPGYGGELAAIIFVLALTGLTLAPVMSGSSGLGTAAVMGFLVPFLGFLAAGVAVQGASRYWVSALGWVLAGAPTGLLGSIVAVAFAHALLPPGPAPGRGRGLTPPPGTSG